MDSDLEMHNNNTTDPWFSTHNVIGSDNQTNKFEDNFNSTFFEKLPDSDEYLALLGKLNTKTDVALLKKHLLYREKTKKN